MDIPVPKPHIGSGKTLKQPFMGKKREETFRRIKQRRIPLQDGHVQYM